MWISAFLCHLEFCEESLKDSFLILTGWEFAVVRIVADGFYLQRWQILSPCAKMKGSFIETQCIQAEKP